MTKLLSCGIIQKNKKEGFVVAKFLSRILIIKCMFNLEEKHDCQGITDEEWSIILKGYKEITGKGWKN